MGDEDLKKKKKIQGGHKGYVTRMIEKIQSLLDHFEPDVVNQLKTYRIALEEKLKILGGLDDEILGLLKEDQIEEEIEETGNFRESIHEMIVKIDEVLLAEVENISDKSNSNSHSEISNSLGLRVKTKLPKLSLKKFHGEAMLFSPFWDSFVSAVDENQTLSDVEKFNYLNNLVEGTAAAAIRGLPLTADNYEAAKNILKKRFEQPRGSMNILKKRFGQPQIIINAHMESLVKIAAVTSDSNLKRLRELYDQVEAHVRALQALGVESGSYGKLLIPILMEKLPTNLRLIISRCIDKQEWDLDVILRAFDSEIEARERCELIGKNSSEPAITPVKSNFGRFVKGRSAPSTASALVTQSGEKSVSCTYCRQKHPSARCTTITDTRARRNLLKQQGRCFICLRRSHLARNCPSNSTCHNCSGKHHVSICDFVKSTTAHQEGGSAISADRSDRREDQERKSLTTVYVDSNTSVLLQTAVGEVSSVNQPHTGLTVRILFDSGSQRSYITERARNKLSLSAMRTEKLLIKTFGCENEQLKECDVVQFYVKGLGLDSSTVQMTAHVVPLICSPLKDQAVQLAQESYEHLVDLELADCPTIGGSSEVDILIGNDIYWCFFTGDLKRGEIGPVAMKTTLGWVLSGPLPQELSSESEVNLTTCHTLRLDTSNPCSIIANEKNRDPLVEEMKKFWELESIGVLSNEASVHDKFLDTIHKRDSRYEVSLPWKEHHPLLPDNYEVAVSRLNSVLKRLKKDPELLAEYNRIIEEQSSKGIISEVDPNAEITVGRLHYLPHHPVIRKDKQTTKVRIVYDASAKSTGPSLNECLYAGPSLISDISDVLMRFRYHRVALSADIEKAFLMVGVAEPDRDVLRFLWVDDPTSEAPKIVVKRFNRVVFGVTSSPFLLNGTLRHHVTNYESEDPQFVNEFLNSLYVDDFNGGKVNDSEAFELYSKAKCRMRDGGFNLRKWISNSQKLMQWIDQEEGVPITESGKLAEEDQTYATTYLGIKGNAAEERKVLGLNWDIIRDTFIIRFDWLVRFAKELPSTKRSILRVVAKLYDPLGFMSPLFTAVKILFQDLCKSKTDWDEPICDELNFKYTKWLFDLMKVHSISIDRCYFLNVRDQVTSLQIHGFGDSSETAYAAVVYLRIETMQGISTQLVMSKTRVAPLKRSTIPRLELLAALILARLVVRVKEALQPVAQVNEVFCWTDSMTTLHWIKGIDKEYKQFVQNRVTEIRQLIPIESWNHCPGYENPADLPSRGMSAEALQESQIWWHGPPWLLEGKDEWPNLTVVTEMPSDYYDEMRSCDKPKNKLIRSTGLVVESRITSLSNVLEPDKFTNLQTSRTKTQKEGSSCW